MSMTWWTDRRMEGRGDEPGATGGERSQPRRIDCGGAPAPSERRGGGRGRGDAQYESRSRARHVD